MSNKNYYYGGDGQSDSDPVVVAYPVNPNAPPVRPQLSSTDRQPSVLRFQNEGAIWCFIVDSCDDPSHTNVDPLNIFSLKVELGNT